MNKCSMGEKSGQVIFTIKRAVLENNIDNSNNNKKNLAGGSPLTNWPGAGHPQTIQCRGRWRAADYYPFRFRLIVKSTSRFC
jgi:hypothetical protein